MPTKIAKVKRFTSAEIIARKIEFRFRAKADLANAEEIERRS
jgi:hypothetical protein